MTNKMGVDAMRAKIEKLTEQVRELKAENAQLRKGKTHDTEVKQVALPINHTPTWNADRCVCGLRLFNGKCLSCKKKNTPLSTF